MTYGFTVREVNAILFTTVTNVQPLLRQVSRNTHSTALTICRFLASDFTPNRKINVSTCGQQLIYVRKWARLPHHQFLLNSQSFSDIMCANPVQSLVQICEEIRTVDRNLMSSSKDACHCENFHGILNSHWISRKFRTRFIRADGQFDGYGLHIRRFFWLSKNVNNNNNNNTLATGTHFLTLTSTHSLQRNFLMERN
jgi:hypothetical protein